MSKQPHHWSTYHASRGAALLLVVVFTMLASLLAVIGIGRAAHYDTLRARVNTHSIQAYYTSESGLEDVVYRMRKGMMVSLSPNTEVLFLGGASATTTITQVSTLVTVQSVGAKSALYRTGKVLLRVGGGASFNYGLQAGNGGISMFNSSSVTGNIYSNGPVSGAGSSMIYGDVVSASTTGLVTGVHATGSVYARTIQSSTINKNAYYQTISGTIVGGTSYPGSVDQEVQPLPITDARIDELKAAAESGGVISSPCPYKITTSQTIGPAKITCDLEISGTGDIITLGGPIWVTGNIIFKNSQTIKVATSLGSYSVALIADNPSDRLTSSKISIENSTSFQGSGTTGSYVALISQNNSSENGGSEVAIGAQNSVSGDLLIYAAHGLIEVANSIQLKEVTAHKIRLTNTANVIYENGLKSVLFSSGPSGGYTIDAWEEVP